MHHLVVAAGPLGEPPDRLRLVRLLGRRWLLKGLRRNGFRRRRT
jgi:hypothetical protein